MGVCSVTQSCPTLQPFGLQPARLLCPWDSQGRNTRVGCHALLQEIFFDPGIEPEFFTSWALASGFFTTNTTWEAQYLYLPNFNHLLTVKECFL